MRVVLKSDNLQYNTLAHWVAGMNDTLTMRLMFQALFFFIVSYRFRALKLERFLQRILQEIMKEK